MQQKNLESSLPYGSNTLSFNFTLSENLYVRSIKFGRSVLPTARYASKAALIEIQMTKKSCSRNAKGIEASARRSLRVNNYWTKIPGSYQDLSLHKRHPTQPQNRPRLCLSITLQLIERPLFFHFVSALGCSASLLTQSHD